MFFDIARCDGLPAAVDDIFHPAGDLQVAVGVPADQVTAAVEAIRVEAAGVVGLGAKVPVEGVRAAYQQFPVGVGWHLSAGVVNDAQFVIGAQRPALGAVDQFRRIAGPGVAQQSLGHPEYLLQARCQRLAYPAGVIGFQFCSANL